MKNKDILKLIALKDLLTKGWCKGHMAETADGKTCARGNVDAVKFCLMGGIYQVEADSLIDELTKEAQVAGFHGLAHLNDSSESVTQVCDFISGVIAKNTPNLV